MLALDTQPAAEAVRSTLRWYQREAVDRTIADLDAGHLNTLVVLATGGGKTNVALETLHEDCLARGGRALWIAHRRELIHQPIARMLALHPEHAGRLGIVMAERDEPHADLVVATVQTLAAERRLKSALAAGPFTHLVTDEAHHAVSPTYLAILAALRRANPDLRHVGYTATPIRTDKDGLRKVYSSVAYRAGIRELISWGYLVPIKAFAVETAIVLKDTPISRATGDFERKRLARVVDVDNAFELVVQTHLDRTPGQKAICFTAGVAGAHRLAQLFRERGISAAAVDGTTPVEVRDTVVRRFRSGDIEVLTNCQVWTEGVDLPELAVAHMVAPCASDLAYLQKLGRVLRPFVGKEHATVFDYVPSDARDLVLAGDVLGKPRAQRTIEKAAAAAGAIIEGFSFTGQGPGLDGDPDEIFTRPLSYLSSSPFAWFVSSGLATLNLGALTPGVASRILLISRPAADGLHRLAVLEQRHGHYAPDITVLGRAGPEEYARLAEAGQRYAEEWADPRLAGKKADWTRKAMTTKQEGFLRSLLPLLDLPAGEEATLQRLSSREAAQLITHALARRGLRAHARRRTTLQEVS